VFALQSSSAICQTLGLRCRELRLARNLSQSELARMTGASLSSIRRFEAVGQGSCNLMVRIALVLQSTEALESLWISSAHNIAQAEILSQVVQRRRARKPAASRKGK